MSRTRKDRPYWVQLNDKGNPTDHDHQNFGKVVYSYKRLRDAEGQLIYEDVPVQHPARHVVGGIWGFSPYITFWPHLVENKAMRTARLLVSAGEGDTLVTIRTERRVVTEKVYNYTIRDYCTEGEKVKRNGRYSYNPEMPCTPELPEKFGYSYLNVSSAKRQFYRDKYNGKNRTAARNTLRQATKAANSGEDGWEDDFEHIERLTEQHRHSIEWDLW